MARNEGARVKGSGREAGGGQAPSGGPRHGGGQRPSGQKPDGQKLGGQSSADRACRGQRGSPGKWSTRRHQAGSADAPRASGGGRREVTGASGNLVIGRNAARERLRHSPKRLCTCPCGGGADDAGSSPIENELHTLLKAAGFEPQISPFDELTRMTGSDSHQGWVLETSASQYRT